MKKETLSEGRRYGESERRVGVDARTEPAPVPGA